MINGHFVEEVVVDVNLMNEGAPKMMLIDSGAPKSVVSREWIDGYIKDMKVDESEIERKSSCRRFRMGETTYISEVEIRFTIVLKTDGGEYMKESDNIHNRCKKSEFLARKTVNKIIRYDVGFAW